MSDENGDTPDTTSESIEDTSPTPDGAKPANSLPHRDWDAFTFHQEKLKHLTSVGLFLAGGIFTLFQMEVIDLRPVHVPALVMVILSSMLSVAAEASLGNEVDDDLDPFDESTDRFGIPRSVHWTEVVVLLLLSGAIGYIGFFFLHSMGIW